MIEIRQILKEELMKAHSEKISHVIRLALGAALLLAASTGVDTLAQAKKRTVSVPRDTEMKIRLGTAIDSKTARKGDRFTATVIDPDNYNGAKLEGRVANVDKSGKIKGQTSITLVFDRIRLRNGTSGVIAAQVVKVYDEKSVKEVDEEGNIKSSSRGESTAKRTAGGAAAGAIIGGIIGGGKGAAIGAGAGAGAGAGSNVIRDSNQVRLESGTELLIRTTR
jgi:hypothetical protein